MAGKWLRVALALGVAGAAPALGCGGERRPTEPPDVPAAGTFKVDVTGTMTASLAGSVSHHAAPSETSAGHFHISMLTPDTTHISMLRKGPEQLRPGTYVVGQGWGGDTVSVALVPRLSDPEWVNNNYRADSGTVVVTYRDSISVIGTLRAVASKYFPSDRSTGRITITGGFHSICLPEHRARGICGR